MMQFCCLVVLALCASVQADDPTDQQLEKWLQRFPAADLNKDGRLTAEEARKFRKQMLPQGKSRKGAPSSFTVDPGWKADRFPEHAICYRTPEEILQTYQQQANGQSALTSYPKPNDGSLRIVATGHSFMAPGFKSLPLITKAAGLKQPPLVTHTGGGITGSARYKWEQENGIFQFNRRPVPKLLAAISNAQWDAMMWGPYYQDQPEYYACWMEFCLKYNSNMKFFIADAWPQLEQMQQAPKSEADLTLAAFRRMAAEKNTGSKIIVDALNEKFGKRVFVMPTNDAMVLAVREFKAGNLPGIEGIHKAVGGKQRSLWVDRLGHLGPGLDVLEGYVFYSTLYKRSPERIESRLGKGNRFLTPELDAVFRKIAWEAVCQHPLSGITDKDGDGIAD